MTTIWKYELEPADRQQVLMPKGAAILCVQKQSGGLCLWAMVDSQEKTEPREIALFGTGNPIDVHPERLKYIGTAQQGPFVWHVFEITY